LTIFATAYRLPKSDMGLWAGCRHNLKFTLTYKITLLFYANLLVGTKEWPGQEKSASEVNKYGYDLDKPYITVMFKDNN